MNKSFFKNKSIAVTGACGSVGQNLIQKLISLNPKIIIAIDNNESKLFELKLKLKKHKNFKIILNDIRFYDYKKNIFENIDIVFHGAALKHVDICEQFPSEAIDTNINALQNLVELAIQAKVNKFIFMSSDKAVNPTNIMGSSKLIGEKIISAANNKAKTIFSSTRFGNVLGSNGSAVRIFCEQISSNKKITITDKKMTRFVMTPNQAVNLLLDSCRLAKGGEVFVTKMPVMNIVDLASSMIKYYKKYLSKKYTPKKFHYIGSRKGEKIYEELLTEDELLKTKVIKNFFVIYDNNQKNSKIKLSNSTNVYRSDKEKSLTENEIFKFLIQNQEILNY